jgi:sulfopyruvate decarboxylase subunit alpha
VEASPIVSARGHDAKTAILRHSMTLGLGAAAERAGFDHILTVPCTILNEWFEPSDRIETIYLSREEEGVGLAVGLLAAGRRPLLLIQNSGLGNCVNALCSLCIAYRVPLVVAVSLRGDPVDDNPAQLPMGAATVPLIGALACDYRKVTAGDQLDSALTAVRDAAESQRQPSFLLLPRRAALC